jgi:uncharacterized protein (TIGR03000 family)
LGCALVEAQPFSNQEEASIMRNWLLRAGQTAVATAALAFASGTAWGQHGHGGGHSSGGEHHSGGGEHHGGEWHGDGGHYGGWGNGYYGWGGYGWGGAIGRSLLWGGYGYPYGGYRYGGYPYYNNYNYGDTYYAPSYNVVPYDSSVPSASVNAPSTAPQPSIDPNAVMLTVKVPANAEVTIDGNKTSQTGTARDFVTPPLDPGKQFNYDIKARWTENGQTVERERHVSFHAGDRLMVNMMTAAANNSANQSSTPAYGAMP